MSQSKRILLGHISSAHGIRGEVLVKSYTGDPQAIGDYGPLTDEAGGRPLSLKVVRVTPKGVIARIKDVADRNAAEALRGAKLFVARDTLPPADEDEFYHADLIGLEAVTVEGLPVGDVIAVQNFGAGDLLEIRPPATSRTLLIPFTKAFAPAVDLAAGRVTVVIAEAAPDDDTPDSDGGVPEPEEASEASPVAGRKGESR